MRTGVLIHVLHSKAKNWILGGDMGLDYVFHPHKTLRLQAYQWDSMGKLKKRLLVLYLFCQQKVDFRVQGYPSHIFLHVQHVHNKTNVSATHVLKAPTLQCDSQKSTSGFAWNPMDFKETDRMKDLFT